MIKTAGLSRSKRFEKFDSERSERTGLRLIFQLELKRESIEIASRFLFGLL